MNYILRDPNGNLILSVESSPVTIATEAYKNKCHGDSEFPAGTKYILYNAGKYILNEIVEKLRSPNKKLTAADYISLAAGVAKIICDLRSAKSSKYDVAEKCLEKDITDIIDSGKTDRDPYAFDETVYKIKDAAGKTHDVRFGVRKHKSDPVAVAIIVDDKYVGSLTSSLNKEKVNLTYSKCSV